MAGISPAAEVPVATGLQVRGQGVEEGVVRGCGGLHGVVLCGCPLPRISGPPARRLPRFGVPSPAVGPMFAGKINTVTYPYYLQPLQMTHNYHFLGNRPVNVCQ